MFLFFFVIVLSLIGGMQYYIYRSYRSWLAIAFFPDQKRILQRAVRITLLAGNLLVANQFLMRLYTWYDRPFAQYSLVYPAGMYFAAVIFGFLLLLSRDLVRFVLFWVRRGGKILRRLSNADSTTPERSSPEPVSSGRRRFLQLSGGAAILGSFGTPIIGSILTAHDYRIVRVPLSFKHLPSGLNGLTIAQVSDVHSGIYMTQNDMMGIVELTNALHPQIIALTGDHVDNSDNQIPAVYNTMKLLKADLGVYGCLGNHDHFATARKVSGALEEVNVVMLNNAHRTLAINGEKLSFIGVDDAGGGPSNFARLDRAMEGLDPESFKILLSHRPHFFDQAKSADMDLTLAGHTHGGQVGVEFWGLKLNPVYLFHKYARGLYVEDGKQLYVNVGVGMVGAPIRFVPPEITLITLYCA